MGEETQRVVDRASAGDDGPSALLTQLGTSASGLTDAEVSARQHTYGPNTLSQQKVTGLRIFVRQFTSPLVYVLAVAAILAFATNDFSDGGIIVFILLLNGILGFTQEYRSERTVEKLSLLIGNRVSVVRNGTHSTVDADALVPGDIVTLKEGDVVPADMKILQGVDVEADESQLTGESTGVAKTPTTDPGGGDASLVFAGSTIDSGELSGVVYAIADDTALGKIATLSTDIRKVTRYQQWLSSFSFLLTKIVVVSLAVTVLLKIAMDRGSANVSQLLIFVIALAVSVVPEALPVIATVTLARGALQLAKQNVVVKRLSSLEDLGDVTILCTDKTGTLTEGTPTITGLVSTDDDLLQTLAWATVDPSSQGRQGTQASFDASFANYIPDRIKNAAQNYALVGEVPFDPGARRRRVLLSRSGSQAQTLVVIGSPETLLDIAACPDRQQYLDRIAAEGRQGKRHLGLAYRLIDTPGSTDVLSLEHDLSFLGYVTLSDPLRAGIGDTLSKAGTLGVGVKILTGDSVEVAEYVAGQVGLLTPGGTVYSGSDLAKLSSDKLLQAAKNSNVFARTSPEQKYSIIAALKKSDVVGYQGDGINDAPSLKLADVGIAVNSATDVAKANSDIILLDQSLNVIISAITYGRSIFANINKYINYTMVGNFGNFIALAILYLLATNVPLLPRQLLLMSLLTDLPLVAISTDSVDTSELARPSSLTARGLLSISLVLGTLTAAVELIFFLTLRGQPASGSETSLYLFLSFAQLVVIFSVRNRDHFWRGSRPSAPLVVAMSLTAVAALAVTYLPPLARLFSFTGPALSEVGYIIVAALVYLFALDLAKVAFYRLTAHTRTVQAPSPPPTSGANAGDSRSAPSVHH